MGVCLLPQSFTSLHHLQVPSSVCNSLLAEFSSEPRRQILCIFKVNVQGACTRQQSSIPGSGFWSPRPHMVCEFITGKPPQCSSCMDNPQQLLASSGNTQIQNCQAQAVRQPIQWMPQMHLQPRPEPGPRRKHAFSSCMSMAFRLGPTGTCMQGTVVHASACVAVGLPDKTKNRQ